MRDSPANSYKNFKDQAAIAINNYITVCKRSTYQKTSDALYTYWGHGHLGYSLPKYEYISKY